MHHKDTHVIDASTRRTFRIAIDLGVIESSYSSSEIIINAGA